MTNVFSFAASAAGHGWPAAAGRSTLGFLAWVFFVHLIGATPSRAGTDVASVTLESLGTSAQTDVPLTFGHAFREGDVPAGSMLGARLSGGTVVPLQLDRKATHGDGSLRHGVVTVRVPSLAGGTAETVVLTTEPSGTQPVPVKFEDLLRTSFDAVVRLTVNGTVYSASARSLLQNGDRQQWLAGPLVSEWLVGGPVQTSGGVAHPHLAAYFHIRAYAGDPIDRVRVDVVVENGWARVPGPGDFTYDGEILVGGNSRYTVAALKHFHHTRWHKAFWWGSEPKVYVRHDHRYLQATKAVSQYEQLAPSDSFLSGLRSRDSYQPMTTGDYNQNMAAGGAADHIGPLPRSDSLYVVTGDRRAFGAMLANSDALGSWAQHYRDEKTGFPVDISQPGNEMAGRNGAGNGDFAAPASNSNPLNVDGAHSPLAAYVPYIVTGDYYYLEEAIFWANMHLLRDITVGTTDYPSTWPRSFQGKQARDQAWSFRDFGATAFIAPDDYPLKNYLKAVVTTNLADYRRVYPGNNALGIVTQGYALAYDTLGAATGISPWQQNFFNYSLARLVEVGFPEAMDLVQYFGRWNLNTLNSSDFCWVFAVSYELGVRPSRDAAFFKTFRELYEANVPADVRSLACGSQAMADKLGIPVGAFKDYLNIPHNYQANQQPAVALLATLGIAGAKESWDLASTRVGRPKYDEYPNYAVVPRAAGGAVATPGTPARPLPRISLAANPSSVRPGDAVTLTWSAQDATSCLATGSWSGSRSITGQESSAAINSSASFGLTCIGDGGSASTSVNVSVGGAETPPRPLDASVPEVKVKGPGSGEGGLGSSDRVFSILLVLLALASRYPRRHLSSRDVQPA